MTGHLRASRGVWRRARPEPFGAIGIIWPWRMEGKPIYVMPLVFGGAPVMNTLFSMYMYQGLQGGDQPGLLCRVDPGHRRSGHGPGIRSARTQARRPASRTSAEKVVHQSTSSDRS